MSESAVAIVGGGTMGTGIAYVFALAGFDSTVVEPNEGRVGSMFAELSAAAGGAGCTIEGAAALTGCASRLAGEAPVGGRRPKARGKAGTSDARESVGADGRSM